MKKLVTLIAMVICLGVSQAQQKSSAGILGKNEPFTSKEDLKKTSQSIAANLGTSLRTRASVKLKKFYKADDGSYIYVRQIDNMVYALVERFDNRFVSVLIGKIESGQLKMDYYYIPKGKAKGHGRLTFKIESKGLKLVSSIKNSGADFNFKSMTDLGKLPTKLPARHRAWYRGNTLDNLTGRWGAENVGVTHFLDLNGKIIGFSRGRRSTHTRPQYASIFVGERVPGRIEGHYIDLPLGHTYGGGATGFKVVGPHFLRVDKNYFPGVDHARKVDDIHEIIK